MVKSTLTIFMFTLSCYSFLAMADEVDDKNVQLQNKRDQLADLLNKKITADRLIADRTRIDYQIKRFNSIHDTVMAQLTSGLTSYQENLVKFKADLQSDQEDIARLNEWLKQKTQFIKTEDLAHSDIMALREEYRARLNTETVCRSPRAGQIADKIDDIIRHQLEPLVGYYHDACRQLPSDAAYQELRDKAAANEAAIKSEVDKAIGILADMPGYHSLPAVCQRFFALENVLALLDVVAEVRASEADIKALNIGLLLSDLQSERQADDYVIDVKKNLVGMQALLYKYLGANDIENSLNLANSYQANIALFTLNADSQLLSDQQRDEIKRVADETSLAMEKTITERLNSFDSLRSMLQIRTLALVGRINSLNRTLPLPAKNSYWTELITYCQAEMNMSVNQRYRPPSLTSKEELLAFDRKVATAETMAKRWQ